MSQKDQPDNVRVCVRMRPMNSKEKEQKCQQCAKVDSTA